MNAAQTNYMKALTTYTVFINEFNRKMDAVVDDGSDEYVNAVCALEAEMNTSDLLDALHVAEDAMIVAMKDQIATHENFAANTADIELAISQALTGKSIKVRKQVIKLAWEIR